MKTTTLKKAPKTSRAGAAGDDYLVLVRRFPLRTLRARREYAIACEILQELMGRSNANGLTDGERDYADVLARLVRDYDERHSSLLAEARKRSPVQLLKALMEERGMNTI